METKRLIETSIHDLTQDLLCVINCQGKFVEINNWWRERTGWTSDAILNGKSLMSLIHEQNYEDYTYNLKLAALLDQSVNFEINLNKFDGSWASFSVSLKRIKGTENFIVLLKEIYPPPSNGEDELAAAELPALPAVSPAQSAHASRLRLLGEMAAGLAHEVNTPLMVVLARSKQIEKKLLSNSIDRQTLISSIQKIISMSERIDKIMRGLLSFSGDGQSDELSASSLKGIVDDSLDLCAARFRDGGVVIKIAPIHSGLTVNCRPIQISQVILNLLNNAFDAVKGAGSPWVEISFNILRGFVEIEVTDSGSGLKPEIAEKIFNPFYTTKEVGEGTGLGLSITTQILHSHGGSIRIDTGCPNTRFVISIPVAVATEGCTVQDLRKIA